MTRYVVIDEHTLGIQRPGESIFVDVLAGKPQKGGHDWKNGAIAIAPGITRVRDATPLDFDYFRVRLPRDFTFARPSRDTQGLSWSAASAQDFLQSMGPLFQELGVTAEIVGSVATRGASTNDLDLLLTPLKPMHLEDLIEAVEQRLPRFARTTRLNPLESVHGDAEQWFLPIELIDGRVVEFYLPESRFPLMPDS